MTLVPIIYTSLLIFSALFFVVMLISYISYKAKTRGKLPKREADFIRFNPAPLVQPAYVHNNPVRRNVQTQPVIRSVVNPAPKAAVPVQKIVYEQNVNLRNNVKVEKSNSREQYAGNQNNNSQNQRPRSTEYKLEKRPTQTRIEIMNEKERYKASNNVYTPPPKLSRGTTGLNEMNILSYYSDSDNTEMVSLNATNVKRAM